MSIKHQRCTTCLLDTTAIEIVFNDSGVCNYCLDVGTEIKKYIFTDEQEVKNLEEFKSLFKGNVNSQGYDCLIGLSGGVDSSYVAYLCKELGLNPLCVHFDNGWNSELAVSNIQKVVDKCGFDLITYVIDWDEFKDLQRSFIKAGVIDIEVLSDHAISASMIKIARKNKIKNVISGSNFRTEHGMPLSWLWLKSDKKNIKSIHKKFGKVKLKTFPLMGIFKYGVIRYFGFGAKFHRLLDLVNYEKNKTVTFLENEFDWIYYGDKHFESTFTKFYQAYILPTKFSVDKRKAHLSCLVRNNEISLQEAEQDFAKPVYDLTQLEQDYDYVIKKLGFSKEEFESIMKEKPVSHDEYPSDVHLYRFFEKILIKFGIRK